MSNILHPPNGYNHGELHESQYAEYLLATSNLRYSEQIERHLRMDDFQQVKQFASSEYDTLDDLIDRIFTMYYYNWAYGNLDNTMLIGWMILDINTTYQLSLTFRENMKNVCRERIKQEYNSLLLNLKERRVIE